MHSEALSVHDTKRRIHPEQAEGGLMGWAREEERVGRKMHQGDGELWAGLLAWQMGLCAGRVGTAVGWVWMLERGGCELTVCDERLCHSISILSGCIRCAGLKVVISEDTTACVLSRVQIHLSGRARSLHWTCLPSHHLRPPSPCSQCPARLSSAACLGGQACFGLSTLAYPFWSLYIPAFFSSSIVPHAVLTPPYTPAHRPVWYPTLQPRPDFPTTHHPLLLSMLIHHWNLPPHISLPSIHCSDASPLQEDQQDSCTLSTPLGSLVHNGLYSKLNLPVEETNTCLVKAFR